MPVELNGGRGRYRAAKDLCLMAADIDHAAIRAWLPKAKAGASHDGEAMSSTERAYRNEAVRLLLWAVLERGKALSPLNVEDVQAFHFWPGRTTCWAIRSRHWPGRGKRAGCWARGGR